MYEGFRDENAEAMRKLATTIKPTERFAMGNSDLSKAGPIASQFFPQPEVNIANLDTQSLIDSLAGADHAKRFKERMKALYPGLPALWNLPAPMPEVQKRNEEMAPFKLSESLSPSTKALGQALNRLQTVKHLKAGMGDPDEAVKAAIANALEAQKHW